VRRGRWTADLGIAADLELTAGALIQESGRAWAHSKGAVDELRGEDEMFV